MITLLYKPNSRNYASTAVLAMAWSSVARCQIVFLGAEVSVSHFGIVLMCLDSSALVRKYLGSEVSWV